MKKIIQKLGLVSFIIGGSILSSCTHSTDLSGIPEVSFSKEVLPIYQSNCAMSGCHGAGDKEAEEFSVASYQTIMEKITPESLTDSDAYSVLTSSLEIMPPSPYKALTKDQRTTIAVWIQQGAKNN